MLYAAVIAFAVGIGAATVTELSLAEVALVSVVGVIIGVVARRSAKGMAARHLLLVTVILFAGSLGMLRTEWHEFQYESLALAAFVGAEYVFSGTIVSEPDERERATHLYVKSGDDTILVFVDRHTTYQYGDQVLVTGQLELPTAFETDLGREFDYASYLLARDVQYTMRYPTVSLIDSGNGNPIVSALLRVKQQLMTGISNELPEPQAGLAVGLLLGVKQALGDALETAFRQSGIIHIVVLSGYNVMLVVAFFRFFLRPLPRMWQTVLGLVAITGFALLVGLSATVVRASIMAGLVLLAGQYARQYDVLRALFFAGFMMIVMNPYLLLYDIGFQLSFMATLGLILIAPRLETAIIEGRWFGAKEFFIATVATQIAVLPLLLYHIGEVSIVSVVVNMLVLPVVPFAMFGAFISGLLSLIVPVLAPPAAFLTTGLLTFIIVTAEWFASLPFATFVVPAFPAYWIAIGYLLPVSLWFWWRCGGFRRNQFTDWEIVEEHTLSKRPIDTKELALNSKATPSKTPIFFQ